MTEAHPNNQAKQKTDKEICETNSVNTFKQGIPIVQGFASLPPENTNLIYSMINYNIEDKMNDASENLEQAESQIDEMNNSAAAAIQKMKSYVDSIHSKCNQLR